MTPSGNCRIDCERGQHDGLLPDVTMRPDLP
jgi:hypothetical protein